MKKTLIKTVEESANELLSLMGVVAKATAKEDKENDAIAIEIDAKDETGLLIGHRGETLEALQAVLGMIVRKKTGEWKRILVNVGDWRQKQESYLEELAHSAAERVKASGESEPLYNLNASQRRVVHTVLSEDAKVETESQGEGQERFLLIKPKK